MNVSFNDFKKLELKIGKITNVEDVEGLDKLYKLSVDLGESHPRTILAGFKQTHQPYELLEKSVVVVCNLEPREIRGIKSEGMILAAVKGGEEPILITPEEELKPGSLVR